MPGNNQLLKKTFIQFIFLIIIPVAAVSQSDRIGLSVDHLGKPERVNNVVKQLRKYRKLYTRDSLQHLRRAKKLARKQLDSLRRELKSYLKTGLLDTSNIPARYRSLYQDGSIDALVVKKQAKSLLKRPLQGLEKYQPLKGYQNLQKLKEKNPALHKWFKNYGLKRSRLKNIPDSLFAYGRKELSNLPVLAEQRLSERGEIQELATKQQAFDDLAATPAEYQAIGQGYKEKTASLTDQEALTNKAKKEAVHAATRYLMAHQDVVEKAQRKMLALKKKYVTVPNSNDLSTAIKHTSMKGHPTGERIVLSADVQFIKKAPFSLDGWVQTGYKFNRDFWAGIGISYRFTLADNPAKQIKYANKAMGYHGFVNYFVHKGFYLIGHYERRRVAVAAVASDALSRRWTDTFQIGIGKEYPLHPLIMGNIALLYNPSYRENSSPYPNRFNVKFGFRLSDTALIKRKIKPEK